MVKKSYYHVQSGISDKGCAIKGLVVRNCRDLESFEMFNCLALGCYQPSPDILIYISPLSANRKIAQYRLGILFKSFSRCKQ